MGIQLSVADFGDEKRGHKSRKVGGLMKVKDKDVSSFLGLPERNAPHQHFDFMPVRSISDF